MRSLWWAAVLLFWRIWAAAVSLLARIGSLRDESSPERAEHVVIIGAGFAGLAVARGLQQDKGVMVTVVDPKDYVEYTPGILRSFLRPEAGERLHVPLARCLPPRSQLRAARCARIEEPGRHGPVDVILEDGSSIGCDRAVLATGSDYAGAIKAPSTVHTSPGRLGELRSAAADVRRARSVCVVGGGAVGVELAAELACAGVTVALASKSQRLLPSLPAAAHRHALRWLARRGVDVRCGVTVRGHADGSALLSDGALLPCARVLACVGHTTNAGPVAASRTLGAAAATGGAASVSDALVVAGSRDRVFAAGDVAARAGCVDDRMAAIAEAHAHAVVRNLRAARLGQPLARFPDSVFGAPTAPRLMCVSLGPRSGILVFNGLVLGGPLGGPLAALVKHVIEVTKLMEFRRSSAAVALWHAIDWANAVAHRTLLAPAQSKAPVATA